MHVPAALCRSDINAGGAHAGTLGLGRTNSQKELASIHWAAVGLSGVVSTEHCGSGAGGAGVPRQPCVAHHPPMEEVEFCPSATEKQPAARTRAVNWAFATIPLLSMSVGWWEQAWEQVSASTGFPHSACLKRSEAQRYWRSA